MLRLILRALFSRPPRATARRSRSVAVVTARKVQALPDAAARGLIDCLPGLKVISVIDGDTVVVAKGWGRTVVRLDSIDCPENGQPWGNIAKYGLIKLVGGHKVKLEEHGIDPHGRTLATIYVWHGGKQEWMNVNERMVTLGHAWVMRTYYDHLPSERQDKLNRLEGWARSKKVGLWNTSDPTPPWLWRRNGRLVPPAC
jgi:micrococcal nuclease